MVAEYLYNYKYLCKYSYSYIKSGRSGLFKVRLGSHRSKVGCKYYDGSDDDRYDDDDDGYDDGDVDDVPTIPILFLLDRSDRVRGSQVLRGRVIYYRHV